MPERYDVAVLGSGHNGLVAAAYLARAGRSVVVLERGDAVGGSAATDEIAPGFRCPAAFAGVETFEPSIVDDLRLADHGLRLLPRGGVLVPGPDGREPLFLAPPGDGGKRLVGGLSAGDAEALVELDRFLGRFADALAPVLGAPLPDLEPSGLSGLFDLLWPGWRLRRLGARDLTEAMRFLPMPIADVVEERFENPALRAAVAAGGLTGSRLGPRSPGSALNLLLHRCGGCRGSIGHPRFAAGGPGALAAALAAAARAAGAEIRTGAEVARIRVDGGAATGVVLASGDEVAAGAVVSGADPRTTLLGLVEARHLEPSVLRTVRNVRGRGAVAIVQYALERLPEISGLDGVACLAGRILVGPTVDDLERAYDDAKYGRLPEKPFVDATLPSLADPDLAPEGRHVLHAWVQYPPRELRDGDWESARDDLGDAVDRALGAAMPGFEDAVVARRVQTPADLEARFGVSGGCLYHVEPALDQTLYLRPMPRWSGYAMPLRNLYLCGAGTHGGGGLTGLPGRNAAQVVLERGRG